MPFDIAIGSIELHTPKSIIYLYTKRSLLIRIAKSLEMLRFGQTATIALKSNELKKVNVPFCRPSFNLISQRKFIPFFN